MIYHECEYCGANLDPGERCDCRERLREKTGRFMLLLKNDGTGQMVMNPERIMPHTGHAEPP